MIQLNLIELVCSHSQTQNQILHPYGKIGQKQIPIGEKINRDASASQEKEHRVAGKFER